MKDLATFRFFLGIEVAYSPRGYLLSQSKYIANIFEQAHLSDSRSADTPLELNVKYALGDGVPLPDPTLYRTLVGSLVYLTITRPDIAYTVHVMSKFVVCPTTVHWAAVLHILRYLRGFQFQILLFPSSSSLVIRQIVSPLKGFVYFLETLLFLGRVRNKTLYLAPPQKLSIVLCHLSFGTNSNACCI